MKKYLIILLTITVIFSFTTNVNAQTQNNEESELESFVKSILSPVVTKTLLLMYSKKQRGTIITVCKYGNLALYYDGTLNQLLPTKEDVNEMFLEKFSPDYSRTGEALATLYDKYVMREVEQLIDNKLSTIDYGLTLISNNKLVKVYLAPEMEGLSEKPDDTLNEGLSNAGEEKDLENRYGSIVEEKLNEYKSKTNKNDKIAIEELTNIYKKLDSKNLEEYKIYLEAILEIASKVLEKEVPVEEN